MTAATPGHQGRIVGRRRPGELAGLVTRRDLALVPGADRPQVRRLGAPPAGTSYGRHRHRLLDAQLSRRKFAIVHCRRIMLGAMRILLILAVVTAMTTNALADSEATAILRNAIAHDKDQQVLTESLAAIEKVIAKDDKDAEAHYARGWVLSHLLRGDDAIAEYDRALAIDPKFAAAAYNAGVVLSELNRDKEALVRFDKALAIDPKYVNAAYNAGQSYYNLKDFKHAADRWTTAQKLEPDDFQIAKKLVQVHNALGNAAAAAKARDAVFALWKAGKAGQIKDYVFDQFDVGGHHIYAFETFDPSGDLAYVYHFVVTDHDQPIGSVNLETSAVIREQGTPYLLGMDKPGVHEQLGKMFKKLPSYRELKPLVIEAIKAKF
jgi:tetratricopeptide (TPR) repeat protein